MLFQLYAISTTLFNLSVASTIWDWNLKEPTDDQGLDYLAFRWVFQKAEPIRFWYAAQQMTFIGPDQSSGTVYCGLQPQPDLNGQPQMRALFSSFIDGSLPESPNCSEGADGGPGVSCAIIVTAQYSSMFTITITPVENSPNNSWHGMLHVEGNDYEIGRFSLPESLTGMDDSQMGFLEDFTGHEGCTRKSPIYVDVYAPLSKKELGALSGFYESTHCPDEDEPKYYPSGDHYGIEKS